MRINHNISALNTINRLKKNNKASNNALEKLSSGYKINRAGDDSAGLAISEKMRGQIRGLNMASKNIQDGISLIQTAEGAMNEIHSLLQRGREIAVQGTNDTNTLEDRQAIQKEVEQIKDEINRIANNTEFNTKKLLDGSLNKQTTLPTPQSTFTASGFLSETFTLSDGWVNFGYGGIYTIKGKLNTGESVKLDEENGLFTRFLVEVEYNSGIPKTISLRSFINNIPIVEYYPSTTISYNGFTIDVSNDIFGPSTTYQSRAVVELTEGNNDSPINNDKDDSLVLQIGANEGQNVKIQFANVSTQALGITSLSVLDNTSAQNSIISFDNAITKISTERSKLGAYQNRLEHAYNSVLNSSENLQSAESRIRDADMAKEMMKYTKNNILLQASQSMLTHSNQQPQSILQLLR